ncbi:MAG: phosphatase [Candidatus Eremiobacteraeota bacterium]|nr:phosphatase [Candidatus Eremiobacteraeota bacterium]
MLVDFHSHTNESDGTLSPAQLCAAMRQRGVTHFSITDHDTLRAYDLIDPPDGAALVVGVEINTTWRENEVHVLGYGNALRESAVLTGLIARNRDARAERIKTIVGQLQDAGYPLEVDDVIAEAIDGAALGRPHVAKALIRRGHVADVETAFRVLLRRGGAGYVPSTYVTPSQAIAAILDSGGVPVLAHPGRLRDYEIIDELVPEGLRGLEVFYPRHEAAQVQYFREKANAHGLLMSGGADFHDIRYHTRGVGMEVERKDIAPFLEALSIG